MAARMVVQRERSATSVRSALDAFSERVGAKLTALTASQVGEGEKAPDWAYSMRLLGRALAQGAEAMRKADDAHEQELADDAAPRDARDVAVTKLYDAVVALREVATGLYTSKVLPSLGLVGSTPRDPVLLVRYAENVVDKLGKVALPASRVANAAIDTAGVGCSLQGLVDELSAAVADVGREEREAQLTLSTKRAAIAAHDTLFGGVATVTEGLLRLVSENDLAEKVRPSARRPGVTVENEDGDEPVTPVNPPNNG